MLVEAGFTPLESIKISTSNGARYEKQLDRIGTIEAGSGVRLVDAAGSLIPVPAAGWRHF